MDFQEVARENFPRILAILCLGLALYDAGRLLGVGSGTQSPLVTMGLNAFALLMLFTLARLFAAVGLWIESSWGGILLLLATIAELALAYSGLQPLDISTPGLVVRLVLLLGIGLLLGLQFLYIRDQLHN